MGDRTVLFDDLLKMSSLRSRTFELIEPPGAGLVCVDLAARNGADWYFARRWVLVRAGRRQLFRTVDAAEAAGFRFLVHRAPRVPPARSPPSDEEPDPIPAGEFFASLDEAEREVHRALFPEEAELLSSGYDWDALHVYRNGAALRPDPFGRILETTAGAVWEWVRIEDEGTWRRYPLQRLTPSTWVPLGTRP